MSELYEKVYRRSPDTVAMPVKVAVPDPIHNSVKIDKNGRHNVSSFASANVNVSGSGGGLSNPKFTMTLVNETEATVENFMGDALIKYEGFLLNALTFVFVDEHETREYELLAGMIDEEDHSWYVSIYRITYDNTRFNFSFSDLVNCTLGSSCIIITDPSLPSSFTLTVSEQVG